MDVILLPIGEGNRILDQVAHGKVSELITETYQGDHERMKQNVNGIALVLQRFQAELTKLIDYSHKGQLEKRGDAAAFEGCYADIIKGINQMLDAILLPIGEGNRILSQVATGKVDELITQTYDGDHEKMKQSVNNIALVMQRFQTELAKLIDYSKQGQLEKRGEASGFQGVLWRHHQGHQPDARCHPAADRRGQPHPRPGRDRQGRRADRQDLRGRP